MFAGGPPPVPCRSCGASVPQSELRTHACDWYEWLDYQVRAHDDDLARTEEAFNAYLASPRGRFEAWYAERDRARRSA